MLQASERRILRALGRQKFIKFNERQSHADSEIPNDADEGLGEPCISGYRRLQPMNAIDVPIERLGLAVGCLARAKSAGLVDARSLSSKSASQLSALGFSSKQIESVRSCLDLNGLALSAEPALEGRLRAFI